MNNTRFAIAIHILTLLAQSEEELLSSQYIAVSINVNPVVIRKELTNLQKNGLVITKAGKYGGSMLAKPAGNIVLSEIYKAVQQTPALGTMRDQPNPHCPVGRQINRHLNQLYQETEIALMKTLGKQTLADFCQRFN